MYILEYNPSYTVVNIKIIVVEAELRLKKLSLYCLVTWIYYIYQVNRSNEIFFITSIEETNTTNIK